MWIIGIYGIYRKENLNTSMMVNVRDTRKDEVRQKLILNAAT
jgi:hypothetical protein